MDVPLLNERIARAYPVVSVQEAQIPEKAIYSFDWLAATGTGIFLAALLSAGWLGIGPRRFVRVFMSTCVQMRWPLFTIACMLAIAFTTRYSGMDATPSGLSLSRSFRLSLPSVSGTLGLAWRRHHRLGYVLKRTFRQFANHHRGSIGEFRHRSPLTFTKPKSSWRPPTARAASWAR